MRDCVDSLNEPLPPTDTVSRIALVKPQKSRGVTELLLRMAQSGQIRQRVTEDQLIGLLDQLEQGQAAENEPKITVRRTPPATEAQRRC